MRTPFVVAALLSLGACVHVPASPERDDSRTEQTDPACPRKMTPEDAKSLAAVSVALGEVAKALSSLAQIKWR